jgi:hypothetical protein
MRHEEILHSRPPQVPNMSLIWTAIVDIGSKDDLGETQVGHRFMVPILGGKFFAGPGVDGLNGIVLSGGADRQIVDDTGYKKLDALYEMKTDCGVILTVRNRVKIDEDSKQSYKCSVIEITAPLGRFDWMNRRVFIGTIDTAKPERDAVIIRGWGQI